MSRCRLRTVCSFYTNEIDVQSDQVEMIKTFCHGSFLDCARYQFALVYGSQFVPRDLKPREPKKVEGFLRCMLD